MLRTVAALALLCALHGVCAVHYGDRFGSQYQAFGRPITDTTPIRSAIRSGADAQFAVTVEGDAEKPAPAPGGEAAKQPAALACDKGKVFSAIFGKCLPTAGTDGYIGKAHDETAKGKGVAAESAFMPITSYAPMTMAHAMPFRPAIPLPLRAQPLSSAATEPPQRAPQEPPRGEAQTRMRGRTVAPVRQLRLACPPGFGFAPAVGACVAPASNSMGPEQLQEQQAMRMRMYRPRGGDDDSDDDDSEERLRRERMHMLRRGHFHRMFGRRFGFGGPRILAPVFVFVLPPLDRNATSRIGMGFGGRMQRIHEIHPSMVGPIGGAATAPPAPAAPEKPIETPKQAQAQGQATENELKPKGAVGSGPEAPKALRGAFVNPIVASGKVLPLKSQNVTPAGEPIRVDAGVDDRIARNDIAPLKAEESTVPEPLLKRHAFVSPFVASHAAEAA